MNNLSYVHGASNVPLLGETIGENLKQTVEKYPDKEALVCRHQNYRATYREFYEQTGKLAKALLALGVKKGDRLGIWAPNCYEWVLVQYATARIGVIMVNLNPAYKGKGFTYAVNQSGISFVISAESFKSSKYKQIITTVRRDCPTLKQVFYLGE